MGAIGRGGRGTDGEHRAPPVPVLHRGRRGAPLREGGRTAPHRAIRSFPTDREDGAVPRHQASHPRPAEGRAAHRGGSGVPGPGPTDGRTRGSSRRERGSRGAWETRAPEGGNHGHRDAAEGGATPADLRGSIPGCGGQAPPSTDLRAHRRGQHVHSRRRDRLLAVQIRRSAASIPAARRVRARGGRPRRTPAREARARPAIRAVGGAVHRSASEHQPRVVRLHPQGPLRRDPASQESGGPAARGGSPPRAHRSRQGDRGHGAASRRGATRCRPPPLGRRHADHRLRSRLVRLSASSSLESFIELARELADTELAPSVH